MSLHVLNIHSCSFQFLAFFFTFFNVLLHVLTCFGQKRDRLFFGVFFTHVIGSRDLMPQANNHQNCYYKGLCKIMVKSPTQRILDGRKKMQDGHLRARHSKKKFDRTSEYRKWQSRGVKMDIGALPRRCRPFSLTENTPPQKQDKKEHRSASAYFAFSAREIVFCSRLFVLGPVPDFGKQ